MKKTIVYLLLILISINTNAQKCVEGNCVNGFGKLVFQEKHHFYKGNFKDSLYHGKGNLTKFGVNFHGNFKKGKKHGKGTMYIDIAGPHTIVGNWSDGQLNGMTSEYRKPFVPPNGLPSFRCNYTFGHRDGVGKTYNKNGILINEEIFKHGYKNGKAKKYNEKGNLIWEGYYHNNYRHGLIKRYDDNGNLISSKLYRLGNSIDNTKKYYETGCVLGDCINGKGKLILTNTENEFIYYYGEFKSGIYEGYGEFYKLRVAENEEVYRGNFKDGKYHGKGILSNMYGYRYDGNWENGKRNGFGIAEFSDIDTKKGFWKNDKFIKKGTKPIK